MPSESDDDTSEHSEESVEEMMQHLDEAKEAKKAERERTQKSRGKSGLQAKIQKRTDGAVLASNFESRLEEIEENDAVTHRSGKAWKSAKAGVEAHGRLPVYYRLDGKITHKAYISEIVLNPDENTDEAEEFLKHISDDDTYGDYNDVLDETTYIVTNGERLDEPFLQSDLRRLSDGGHVDENYSRQPAYVIQRPGDFPDFL